MLGINNGIGSSYLATKEVSLFCEDVDDLDDLDELDEEFDDVLYDGEEFNDNGDYDDFAEDDKEEYTH
jgi:hypothetical protein